MDTSLQIRFTPDKNDYLHASRALASKSPIFLILAAFTVLVMLFSIVILIYPAIGGGDFTSAAVMALIVGGFYFIYYFFLIPLQLSRAFAKNEYLQNERIMTFSDEHITLQSGSQSSDLEWENVGKVMNGKELYIIAYKAKEKVYPFLPKRVLSKDNLEEDFLKLLEKKSIAVK